MFNPNESQQPKFWKIFKFSPATESDTESMIGEFFQTPDQELQQFWDRNQSRFNKEQREKCWVHAVQKSHTGAMIFLLKQGININAVDGPGWTALHRAAAKGDEKVLDVLLATQGEQENPIIIDVQDQKACTPLYLAVEQQKYNAVVMLLNKGAQIEDKIFHIAAEKSNIELMQLFLAKGANIDARNRILGTPLHRASETGDEKVAQFLLERGADKEAQDQSGNTPLHYAAIWGCVAIVDLLLEHKANKKAQNKKADTPFDCALQNEHKDLQQRLLVQEPDFEPENKVKKRI